MEMQTIISLGAGVQSSTLALMAAHGEVEPMPAAAIFADTGAEPRAVYQWLDYLESLLPFPVLRVSAGNIVEDIRASVEGGRFATAPFYTTSPKGGGMLRRQCTREFKIDPVHQEIRRLVGLAKGQRAPKGRTLVCQWIGISLDEMVRMKESRFKWVETRWPLIERRMVRWDCLQWMARHGYPEPPRSACSFCPYHRNDEWRTIRDEQPDAWNQALDVDRMIRNGVRGTTERLYLHPSMQPLDEVDLSTPEDHGQVTWLDECDGMCGV